MPVRGRALLPWLLVQLQTLQRVSAERRELITIENEKSREDSIDPDEYLWETLPGRCCFAQDADDCDLCSVWSDPQNFCHSSSESCELCGMSLYCPAPPPLLNADKVCMGTSRVGMGCKDDLDTGLCQKSGALAACQASCRHTKHCEMIVLYTDSMAGTCVLCRNMLDYLPTGQQSTRVYAVEHLDMAPPSPPGYEKQTTKHFSILQEPSPPPPPQPPPSPPRAPPPPLPAVLGHRGETHIECEFADGMDYTVVSADGHHAPSGITIQTTDTVADTKKHCCSQCGMHAGCSDFVYEPSSKTCVLMPPLPSYMLKRSPNNSTIAGSVTITRLSQSHAACHFNIGSGYAGGAIGIGKALPGKKMASQQDCCDACDRDPSCAKFVFEHFAGDCQLFGPQAEHYYTFNLLSGTVDGRAEEEVDTRGGMGGGYDLQEDDQDGSDDKDENPWDSFNEEFDVAPPTPPFLNFATHPPPSPPGGEDSFAQEFLADFSLVVGFLILFGFAMCGYLFFSQEIQLLLYTASRGVLGKKPNSLLPVNEPVLQTESAADRSRNKKGALLPGWAMVTVQTAQLQQRKEVEVGGCQTLDDLHEIIWDEFGHLLTATRVKDTVVLVWASDADASDENEQTQHARWMKVTSASDMHRVVECDAIKLRDKKALDVKALAVAFAKKLTSKGKSKNAAARLALKQKETEGSDEGEGEEDGTKEGSDAGCSGSGSDEDDDGEAEGGIAAALKRRLRTKRGGFTRLAAAPEDSSDDDAGRPEPLCADAPVPKRTSPAQTACNGRASGKLGNREKKAGAAAGAGARKTSNERGASRAPAVQAKPLGAGRACRTRATAACEDEADAAAATPELVGKRVVVHALSAKADLNGREGVVTTFDKAKARYRVRLDPLADSEQGQLLAFRMENLKPL